MLKSVRVSIELALRTFFSKKNIRVYVKTAGNKMTVTWKNQTSLNQVITLVHIGVLDHFANQSEEDQENYPNFQIELEKDNKVHIIMTKDIVNIFSR